MMMQWLLAALVIVVVGLAFVAGYVLSRRGGREATPDAIPQPGVEERPPHKTVTAAYQLDDNDILSPALDRQISRQQRLLRAAHLPWSKALADYDHRARIEPERWQELEDLARRTDWLLRGENVLLFGPSGVGKTHIAKTVPNTFSIEETFDVSVPFNANAPQDSDFDISNVGAIVAAVRGLVEAEA